MQNATVIFYQNNVIAYGNGYYAVGDQKSYLRIMLRTGPLLADLGQSLGYALVGIDLFRTRLATATKEELREKVVGLRCAGK